ncbi:MAG: hypothetical protein U9Q62_06055 [Campylobacterota bacterium]|nr:hypothetical protein [Campylobacterota bacterium]
MTRSILFLLFGIDAIMLFYETTLFSISYREADFLYHSSSLLNLIITTSINLFGQNDFALRLPMVIVHLISALLLYKISGRYLKREHDRLWLLAVFMLIPGVNSAALLLDNSGLVIMLLLFYVTLLQRSEWVQYLFLIAVFWIDVSFAILYLGLFFYALREKNSQLLVISLLLFSVSLYFHNYLPHGAPQGHFLDTLGLYAAIFSPIVFIYLFFVLYRRFVAHQQEVVWYLSTTALISSLLLSFRQEMEIQVFAPYLILALPLAAQNFFHSYRVRLRPFRKNYRVLFTISFILLLANTLVLLFHKELYRVIERPSKHFAYRQHIAKELAEELYRSDITCVDTGNNAMQLRLQFYGIETCEMNRFTHHRNGEAIDVTVRYKDVPVYQIYVSKTHI